jgi:hypothetical protein
MRRALGTEGDEIALVQLDRADQQVRDAQRHRLHRLRQRGQRCVVALQPALRHLPAAKGDAQQGLVANAELVQARQHARRRIELGRDVCLDARTPVQAALAARRVRWKHRGFQVAVDPTLDLERNAGEVAPGLDQRPVHARVQQSRQGKIVGAHPGVVDADITGDLRPHRGVEDFEAAHRHHVGARLDVPAEQGGHVAQCAGLVVQHGFDRVRGRIAVPERVQALLGLVGAAGDEAVPAEQGADRAAGRAADRHQHRRVRARIQARLMVRSAAPGVGQRQVVEFAQQYRQYAAGERCMTAAALAGNRYVPGCHRRLLVSTFD